VKERGERRERRAKRKEREKMGKRWEPHNTNPTTLVQRHRHRAAAVAPAWQSAVQSSLAVSSDGCSPKLKSPIGPPQLPPYLLCFLSPFWSTTSFAFQTSGVCCCCALNYLKNGPSAIECRALISEWNFN
jgi:hypothetical protein